MADSMNSSGLTESSPGSSVLLADSRAMEDLSGFDSNLDSDINDPFNNIFYHVMPAKDSTNILFYNKPLFNNILTVLGKEFKFPSEDAKKFHIKTHVNSKRCNIYIDRDMMSLCASGPGHVFWKENNFRKLSEHMYRSFVRSTNSVLNTSLDIQDNQGLSGSQVPTQDNQSGSNYTTLEEPEVIPPAEPEAEQLRELSVQVESTQSQDTPIMRQISTLMDMIHTLQGQITTLTNQVNDLVCQAASKTVYRTVDETNISTTLNDNMEIEETVSDMIEGTDRDTTDMSSVSVMPQPGISYNQIVRRTSTPKTSKQQDSNRPRPAPRLNQQQKSRSPPRPKPRQSIQDRNNSEEILLMGDSLISSVNPKGLKHGVFKQGIPGAKIDHLFNQAKVFNIKQFSHVIIYVGGNDASSGTDTEYFEERYEQVIQYLKQVNSSCKIYICNVCPRRDTDTSDVNEAIHRVCQHNDICMIDVNKAFYDKRGTIIGRYYAEDSIHLSASGVKRLTGAIDREISIVADYDSCVYIKRQQKNVHVHKRRVQVQSKRQSKHGSRKAELRNYAESDNIDTVCYKCGESNHDTGRCRHAEQLKCFHCGFYGHKSIRCLNR